MAQLVEKEAMNRMIVRRTKKGWMDGDVFYEWLARFDDQLTVPPLLLLDSCPAHNKINMRDPFNNTPWKFLRIRRLPHSQHR